MDKTDYIKAQKDHRKSKAFVSAPAFSDGLIYLVLNKISSELIFYSLTRTFLVVPSDILTMLIPFAGALS